MGICTEPGVLPQSVRFFSTPSTLGRQLFLYVTRCGHYFCDRNYDFRDSSDIGQQESHKNFLLSYLRCGALHYEADGRRFTAEEGQCALIDCRRPHRYSAAGETEFYWLHFDGAQAGTFYHQILALHQGRQSFFPPEGSGTARDLAHTVQSLAAGVSMPESEFSLLLYRILCRLITAPAQQANLPDDSPIGQALRYIAAHLTEELSVPRVAAVVNLSPAHFSREFKRRTGTSPHEYIVLHRIDEAKALLLSTGLSVKEIAYRTGYHSEINFISSFTGKTGLSPASFRHNPI